jgi:hypothetical protein
MSAMPIPHEWIFAGQVREIQAAFPLAHDALINWGAWSRDRQGIFPCLARMSLWDEADTEKFEDFAEEGEQGAAVVPQAEVKAEAANDEPFMEREAVELDRLMHSPDFPAIWRKCIAAAYFARVLEYQLPREATYIRPREMRLSHDSYLAFLDGALRFIDTTLCGSRG